MSADFNRSKLVASSAVARMFNGRSVLITGASGFIGRVLLEKLLRCYTGIKQIYILLRTKKNQSPVERLNKRLLNAPLFDRIRTVQIDGKYLLDKIVIVPGDIGKPRLGISDEYRRMMIEDPTLSIIFHSAATIKFDEQLKVSVQLNLIAVRELLELCRCFKNIVSVCHVSTAYVNSNIYNGEIIEERLYSMKQTPQQVIDLAERMDGKTMQAIKSELVDDRPNTYTYTKALAEHFIAAEFSDLPIAIVRPSIVGASWREPLPGWVDNLNGATGIFFTASKGWLRSLLLDECCPSDVIPVDIAVNTIIAASYYTAVRNDKIISVTPVRDICDNGLSAIDKVTANGTHTIIGNQINRKKENAGPVSNGVNKNSNTANNNQLIKTQNNIPIFHCTSGDSNPITWGKVKDTANTMLCKYPSNQLIRHPIMISTKYKRLELFKRLYLHYLPALILEILSLMMGKKRQMLENYRKLHTATEAVTHFTIHNYNFSAKNFRLLKNCLYAVDQQELYMDVNNIEWTNYYDQYILGIRRYFARESDESIDQARRKSRRAYFVEKMAICLICCTLIMSLWQATRQT